MREEIKRLSHKDLLTMFHEQRLALEVQARNLAAVKEALDKLTPMGPVKDEPTPEELEKFKGVTRGNHKIGDWVVGMKCLWNGTNNKEDHQVPGCGKILAPYRFNGKYYCCSEKHELMMTAIYAMHQLEFFLRTFAGNPTYKLPFNVETFARILLSKGSGKSVTAIAADHRLPVELLAAIFNSPIIRRKYPQYYKAYDPDLLDNLQKIPVNIVACIRSDMKNLSLNINVEDIIRMFCLPPDVAKMIFGRENGREGYVGGTQSAPEGI